MGDPKPIKRSDVKLPVTKKQDVTPIDVKYQEYMIPEFKQNTMGELKVRESQENEEQLGSWYQTLPQEQYKKLPIWDEVVNYEKNKELDYQRTIAKTVSDKIEKDVREKYGLNDITLYDVITTDNGEQIQNEIDVEKMKQLGMMSISPEIISEFIQPILPLQISQSIHSPKERLERVEQDKTKGIEDIVRRNTERLIAIGEGVSLPFTVGIQIAEQTPVLDVITPFINAPFEYMGQLGKGVVDAGLWTANKIGITLKPETRQSLEELGALTAQFVIPMGIIRGIKRGIKEAKTEAEIQRVIDKAKQHIEEQKRVAEEFEKQAKLYPPSTEIPQTAYTFKVIEDVVNMYREIKNPDIRSLLLNELDKKGVQYKVDRKGDLRLTQEQQPKVSLALPEPMRKFEMNKEGIAENIIEKPIGTTETYKPLTLAEIKEARKNIKATPEIEPMQPYVYKPKNKRYKDIKARDIPSIQELIKLEEEFNAHRNTGRPYPYEQLTTPEVQAKLDLTSGAVIDRYHQLINAVKEYNNLPRSTSKIPAERPKYESIETFPPRPLSLKEAVVEPDVSKPKAPKIEAETPPVSEFEQPRGVTQPKAPKIEPTPVSGEIRGILPKESEVTSAERIRTTTPEGRETKGIQRETNEPLRLRDITESRMETEQRKETTSQRKREIKRNIENPFPKSVIQEPVYHGTTKAFKTFKTEPFGTHFGSITTASDFVNIKEYKVGKFAKPNIHKAFIDLRNPIILDNLGSFVHGEVIGSNLVERGYITKKELSRLLAKNGYDIYAIDILLDTKKYDKIAEYMENEVRSLDLAHDLKKLLQDKGYDGVIYENTMDAGTKANSYMSYIVFDKKQIMPYYSKKNRIITDEMLNEANRIIKTPPDKIASNPAEWYGEMSKAYLIKGARLIEDGVIVFKDWAKKMIDEFGHQIVPYLEELYSKAKSTLETQKDIKPVEIKLEDTPTNIIKETIKEDIMKQGEAKYGSVDKWLYNVSEESRGLLSKLREAEHEKTRRINDYERQIASLEKQRESEGTQKLTPKIYELGEELKAYKKNVDKIIDNIMIEIGKDKNLTLQQQILEEVFKDFIDVNNPTGSNFKKLIAQITSGLFDQFYNAEKRYGANGTEMLYKLHDGNQKTIRYYNEAYPHLVKAKEVMQDISWEKKSDPNNPNNYDRRVIKALTNRKNADVIIGNDPILRTYYDGLLEMYEYMRAELEKIGIKTVEDYYTRISQHKVLEQFGDIRNLIDENSGKSWMALNEAISVDSPYVNQRTGKLKDIIEDPLWVAEKYYYNMSRHLAYKEAVDYYFGDFTKTMPRRLAKSGGLEYMNKLIKDNLNPEYLRSKTLSIIRDQIYITALWNNPKNILMNKLQRDFVDFFTTKEATEIAREWYKKDKTQYPNQLRILLEGLQYEIPEYMDIGFEMGLHSKYRNAMEKIDMWRKTEQINWRYAHLSGVFDALYRIPEFKEAITQGRKPMEIVGEMLKDKEIYKTAYRRAVELSNRTQFGATIFNRPALYRNPFMRYAALFTRFKFGQIQVIRDTLRKTEGITGLLAKNISRRGVTENMYPVELLREVETARVGLEQFSKKLGEPNTKTFVNNYIKFLKEQETQLNGIIKTLEPLKPKAEVIAKWLKYYTKTATISFSWRMFTNWILYNAIEDSEDESFTDMLLKTAYDLSPAPFYGTDMQGAFKSPIVPTTELFLYGNLNIKGFTKEMMRYGMRISPLGIIERFGLGLPSKYLINKIFPSDEIKNPKPIRELEKQLREETDKDNPDLKKIQALEKQLRDLQFSIPEFKPKEWERHKRRRDKERKLNPNKPYSPQIDSLKFEQNWMLKQLQNQYNLQQ